MAAPLVLSAVIFVTCMVCYYNSLQCGFVFDDISAIKDNRDLRPHMPLKNIFFNDFWGTPIHKEQSHKSYRPLCILTFRWNYSLHQLEPMGYHLVNMMLHSIVCLMYFRMCSMFLPEISSFIASMLFAVHPIHTEAVTGVVGRAETLSSVFFLAAFIFYTKSTKTKHVTGWRHLILSMISVATAMLCKEQGITITGICAVYELIVAQKLRLSDLHYMLRSAVSGKGSLHSSWTSDATKRLSVLGATTICLLMMRLQIMGSRLPVFTRFDNPASVAPTPVRQLTYNYLISVNLWLLLFPCDLCCDWTMGTVPLIESFLDARNLTTLISYAILSLLTYVAVVTDNRQQATVIIMSLVFLILPFLPASNLFFPVGFVVAERILYIPSMGFCMLIAYGWSLMAQMRFKKLAWLSVGFLLLVHGCKTYTRNLDWESEYTIFMSGLKVNQRNAKLFNNVGHALESQGRFHEALQYFQKAVSVQQDDIGAHINVGRTFNHLKMFKEAEDAYLKAKSLLPKAKPGKSYQARIAPNHLNVFLNLANLIARNETRLEEADLLYRQAISMRADYTQAYINRGDILLKLNRTKEAQEVYERALFYDSNNPDIYYNLGVVFLEQGKASQALAYLDKALEFDPEHEQALLNSAILLQELGRAELRKVARERLLKLLRKDATNERVHFNLGMLAMDDRDFAGAEHWFRRAIQLKEDFRSALFNLALLLTDDHRPLEAAPFLNQLVKFYPDHIKGLILLGDIYINTIKDLDAAENCYIRILQLDPENVQGLHNLCVVYVERGNLLRAEACLIRAHRLAPNEEYVLKHLNIVQSKIMKLQIPRTSDEGREFEDFGDAHNFQHYEENFDDDNLGGDFDDEFDAEDLEGIEDFGRDITNSHNHKASLRKAYLVRKKENSDVADHGTSEFTDTELHKQKPSETRHAQTLQASSVQNDYTRGNSPNPTREDTSEQQRISPRETQHSTVKSHETNSEHKSQATSTDPVFSNTPSNQVERRQEKKSSETIFADSLKKQIQRKTLGHNELNKHSSS